MSRKRRLPDPAPEGTETGAVPDVVPRGLQVPLGAGSARHRPLFAAAFIFFPFCSRAVGWLSLVSTHLRILFDARTSRDRYRPEPVLSLARPTPGPRSPQTGLFQSLLPSPSLP